MRRVSVWEAWLGRWLGLHSFQRKGHVDTLLRMKVLLLLYTKFL